MQAESEQHFAINESNAVMLHTLHISRPSTIFN